MSYIMVNAMAKDGRLSDIKIKDSDVCVRDSEASAQDVQR